MAGKPWSSQLEPFLRTQTLAFSLTQTLSHSQPNPLSLSLETLAVLKLVVIGLSSPVPFTVGLMAMTRWPKHRIHYLERLVFYTMVAKLYLSIWYQSKTTPPTSFLNIGGFGLCWLRQGSFYLMFLGMMIDACSDWAVSWIAALFLDYANCAAEVSIHTPSLWGEEVTNLMLGCCNL